ncbi:MAG TPA: hypothetical protein VN944_06445 [Nitrospiria bacterium]|nr:hypothetical protein [Nitrospiria bacterium]
MIRIEHLTVLAFFLFGSILFSGCSKNADTVAPGGTPAPAVSSAAPASPTPQAQDPYAQGASPGVMTAQAASGGVISGTVSLDSKLASKVSPDAVLFISAKPAEGPQVGVPPVASKRLDHVKFPLEYTLSQADVIMPGTPFSGKFNIVVKLMKNGAVGPMGPGDIEGQYFKNPAEVGQKGIDVTLSKIY